MIVTMDMAGPLPETLRGNKHILAMCDRFTKHIKVFSQHICVYDHIQLLRENAVLMNGD